MSNRSARTAWAPRLRQQTLKTKVQHNNEVRIEIRTSAKKGAVDTRVWVPALAGKTGVAYHYTQNQLQVWGLAVWILRVFCMGPACVGPAGSVWVCVVIEWAHGLNRDSVLVVYRFCVVSAGCMAVPLSTGWLASCLGDWLAGSLSGWLAGWLACPALVCWRHACLGVGIGSLWYPDHGFLQLWLKLVSLAIVIGNVATIVLRYLWALHGTWLHGTLLQHCSDLLKFAK